MPDTAPTTDPNPGIVALENAINQTLSVAIPVFTQAGLTALFALIQQAINKHLS